MNDDERVALVRRAVESFVRADFESVLAVLDANVEWPDFRGEGVLRGRGAVRRYWQEIFERSRPSVLLGHAFALGADVMAVAYVQLYDLEGHPIGEPSAQTQRFIFNGDLVARMETSRLDVIPDEIMDIFRSR